MLAARRSGVRTVVFPQGNQPEYDDLPAELKEVRGSCREAAAGKLRDRPGAVCDGGVRVAPSARLV